LWTDAIVEWIARQPWCDGNVGMWAFLSQITSLATAATRPPIHATPIHATTDPIAAWSVRRLRARFWMRGDRRMLAYNLTPPPNGRDAGRKSGPSTGGQRAMAVHGSTTSFNNTGSRVAPMERPPHLQHPAGASRRLHAA
jgi:predicted acyl esterase